MAVLLSNGGVERLQTQMGSEPCTSIFVFSYLLRRAPSPFNYVDVFGKRGGVQVGIQVQWRPIVLWLIENEGLAEMQDVVALVY